MNMKSNLPQHPCKGKCSNFRTEQCNTCLIAVESDFTYGDMVVKTHGDDNTLYVFAMQSEINPEYGYIGEPDAECGECIALTDIRTASVAEVVLNCRLPNPSQLFIAADMQKHHDRAVARGEIS